ncbi:MAG: hypothetical protein ABEJ36_00715 [Candidatus Nanosalina sp.]
MQDRIGRMLSEGVDPGEIRSEVDSYEILESEENCGVIYPDIVTEIGNRAQQPDASSTGCFSDYEGEADLVLTNNVGDFMGREELLYSADAAGADYVEMYSTTIAPEMVIGNVAGDTEFEPDFDPEVDFWWAPESDVTLAFLSRES